MPERAIFYYTRKCGTCKNGVLPIYGEKFGEYTNQVVAWRTCPVCNGQYEWFVVVCADGSSHNRSEKPEWLLTEEEYQERLRTGDLE